MKKLIVIILICLFPGLLFSQEAFLSAGKTAVRQDTTFGNKQFGRLITSKADSNLYLGMRGWLKQVALMADSAFFTDVSLAASLELPTTTTSTTGVIYKGTDRFIHDFDPPHNGSVDPDGFLIEKE